MVELAKKSSLAPPEAALDKLVQRAGQLFSLPAVAIEVIDLTNRPDVDADALKSCIECDPALTGKILRVVNSSLFGLHGEISNLTQALTLLGIKPLKLLVLGFSLPDTLFDDLSEKTLHFYWQHTLTKAVAAKELAEQIWNVPGDEAWIAGLLQDIGMLALIQDLGDSYVQFLDRVGVEEADLIATQQELMGFNHTDLTAQLLEKWRLPNSLVSAARCQQLAGDWDSIPENSRVLCQITYQAEYLAQLLADRRPGALGHLLEPPHNATRLTLKQLESLIETLGDKVLQMADLLNVPIPDEQDYTQIIADAEKSLVALADDHVKPDRWNETESLSHALGRALDRGDSLPPSTPTKLAERPDTWNADSAGLDCDGQGSRPRSAKPTRRANLSSPSSLLSSDDGAGYLKLSKCADRILARCRQAKQPASLVFVETSAVQYRWEQLRPCFMRSLADLIRDTARSDGFFLRYTERRIAIVLQGCDRHQTVRFGRSLIDDIHSAESVRQTLADISSSVSAGVATVNRLPINFPFDQWIEAAERCLFASHTSGGNIVKSIEIF